MQAPGRPDLCCDEASIDLVVLSTEWRELEKQANNTVFLSWEWIGVWLSVYQPDAKVIRVTDRGRLVGLGILSRSVERRHGLLYSRCLNLHQTGRDAEDQIWIEYNGFLAARGYEASVAVACLNHLLRSEPDWDEFIIGAAGADYVDSLSEATGLVEHVRWEAPSFGVDLASLRSKGQSYLGSLSGNSRHQIRRSLRRYEEKGKVYLERPTTMEEADITWSAIAPFHLARWGSEMGESGFANPDFVRFHQSFIRANWSAGVVDLIVLKAGEEVIAIFYNFLYRNRIYFYLAGIRAEADNRLKPGMLGHALCIEDYLDRGFDFYDFMGGDERYKRQLGVRHQYLVQAGLQRDRWKLRAERAVRTVKKRWELM
ncbi:MULTISPECIES: GNAT family N-acetyltransferase [unclassified Marinobacter]|uniref:GNAT family N-acetyltransferase n=1 Tax=unclassified Marinobacter TaxID=83889 RepID=UPI0018F146EE|nr:MULTISPECIES: GNAT family N-acetyltransferase [unclassified Marinobacter]